MKCRERVSVAGERAAAATCGVGVVGGGAGARSRWHWRRQHRAAAGSSGIAASLRREEGRCARTAALDQSRPGGGPARKTHGSICEGLCTDDSGQVVSRP